jgi:hypothetical protein
MPENTDHKTCDDENCEECKRREREVVSPAQNRRIRLIIAKIKKLAARIPRA